MSIGGSKAALPTDARAWRPDPIAGVTQASTLSAPFQYFAAFWHMHSADGDLPGLRVLEQPDAPPVLSSGIVFAAQDVDGGVPEFRVFKASDQFEFYYRRKIIGCRLDELFESRVAHRRRERYARILGGGMPDFSKRRSGIPGREIVWIERIYAPFADDKGAPAFLAGLVKLAYA